MRIYILYDKNGEISETADAGYGYEFDEKEIQNNHPDKNILEITEIIYEEIKNDLVSWKVIENTIIKKTEEEMRPLRKIWAEQEKTCTIRGLQNQIDEIKKMIKKSNI